MAATFPGGCGGAVLGSDHQPALIYPGTDCCTRVQVDPHLILPDPSKSRPISLNHIPWACSL